MIKANSDFSELVQYAAVFCKSDSPELRRCGQLIINLIKASTNFEQMLIIDTDDQTGTVNDLQVLSYPDEPQGQGNFQTEAQYIDGILEQE